MLLNIAGFFKVIRAFPCAIMVNKRQKKTPELLAPALSCFLQEKTIVLRTVDAFLLYADPLSYAQLPWHHESRNPLYAECHDFLR